MKKSSRHTVNYIHNRYLSPTLIYTDLQSVQVCVCACVSVCVHMHMHMCLGLSMNINTVYMCRCGVPCFLLIAYHHIT